MEGSSAHDETPQSNSLAIRALLGGSNSQSRGTEADLFADKLTRTLQTSDEIILDDLAEDVTKRLSIGG